MLFKKSLSPDLRSSLDRYILTHYESGDTVVCEEAAIPPIPTPIPMQAAGMGKAAAPRRRHSMEKTPMYTASAPMPQACSLDDALSRLDESFQEMLLRKIDEKDMKDSTCYKRAGVDRKLFSKIRSNPQYKPKKSTAVAFCIALELSIDESRELLRKAGYALSHSSKFDVIVEYFLLNRRYSVSELNLALYEYDQPLI